MRLLDKFKNVTEAEVGSGTSIKDTQDQQKRAKLNLQAAELKLKQEKERIALQKKKAAVKVKEETDMTESFSASQIAALKAEYAKINTIDPSSDTYKKLIAMLDKLDAKSLEALANAGVKFVSKLAQNRVARRKPTNEGRSIKEYMSDNGGRYVHKGTYGREKSAAAGYSGHDDDDKPEIHPKDKAPVKKGANQNRRVDTKLYKKEELSPKQKEIDKNKNGKIDGEDLAKLRSKSEELSPKQKALDKNKNGKIDGSDLAKLRKEEVENINEKSDYEVYHKDYSGAVQTAIKQAEKRGYEVDMDDWHDKVATGPKKPSAGKTNSFSVNLMKDGKESKKKLHLQVYNMDNHKYELNMYIESVEEASSPAQQAAIAIAMKKAGKKPKDMKEEDAYDKDVKSKKKPHDKEAAAKRAVLAARAARKAMTTKNEAKDISINATTKKITKGQTTKTGVAKWLGEPTEEKVPEFKTGGDKLAKKFDKAFKSLGIKSNVKIKTVNNISMNEIDEEKKKDSKETTANDKKKSIKQGEKLSGKQEPITIDPELNQTK